MTALYQPRPSIEESAVRQMNQDVVAELEGAYHSTNVSRLYSYLRRI